MGWSGLTNEPERPTHRHSDRHCAAGRGLGNVGHRREQRMRRGGNQSGQPA